EQPAPRAAGPGPGGPGRVGAEPDAPADALTRQPPPVRGRLTANAPIGPLTWFRVGGPAELLFRPADPEDLAAFLSALPADVSVTVIAVGSNLPVLYRCVPGVTM